MSGQLSFAWVGASPRPVDGLFFAVLPDEGAAAEISRVSQCQSLAHGLKGKPVLAERLHISLHSIGEYAGVPRGIVAVVCETGAAVVMPPFCVAFDRVVSFGGRSAQRLTPPPTGKN